MWWAAHWRQLTTQTQTWIEDIFLEPLADDESMVDSKPEPIQVCISLEHEHEHGKALSQANINFKHSYGNFRKKYM